MITSTLDGTYRASCTELECPRPLMREVVSETHAKNLFAKHRRDYHGDGPEVFADEVAELISIVRAARADWDEYSHIGDDEAIARAVLAANYARPPM